MSASLSGKSLLVYSILVSLCAVNALGIGHTVVVTSRSGAKAAESWQRLQNPLMEQNSKTFTCKYSYCVYQDTVVLLFFISCLPDGLTFLEVVSSH